MAVRGRKAASGKATRTGRSSRKKLNELVAASPAMRKFMEKEMPVLAAKLPPAAVKTRKKSRRKTTRGTRRKR